MRKKIIILFILMMCAKLSISQNTETIKIKHIKGLKGCDLKVFVSGEGKGISAGYVYFFGKHLFANCDLTFEKGKKGFTNFYLTGLNIKPSFVIANPVKKFYINGYIPCIVGFTNLKNKELSQKQIFFTEHLGVGFSAEYYVSAHLAVLLNGEQMIFGKKKFGDKFYSISFGLRYVFI